MWEVRVRKPARKSVLRALDEMEREPFTGDIQPLRSQPTAWRRRVGDWRIFFDVYPEQRLVDVVDIDRRTTTTYRRR